MDHLWQQTMHHVNRMGPHQWELILAAMILVAFICMRGFGSRSQY